MEAELLLSGGTIVDGTGAPPFPGDVAIYGGRIVAIDRPGTLTAAELVDCSGTYICPGFVDMHAHSDLECIYRPELWSKTRQGVSFVLCGQDGISVAPNSELGEHFMRPLMDGLNGFPGKPWDWTSVGDYLGRVQQAGPAADIGYLAPHGNIRMAVMGFLDRPATADEIEEMCAGLDRALEQGALGLSTGLIYPPCCYATTGELIALAEVVAKHDALFFAHIRNEGDRVVEAAGEFLRIGERAGCRLHFSHLKVAGRQNYYKVSKLLRLIDRARARGMHVTADQYPYVAGSTTMSAVLPPWVHAGGVDEAIARMRTPELRARMRLEILDPNPADWDNFWKWSGPTGLFISDIPSGRHPEWVGKSLHQIQWPANEDPLEGLMLLLEEERMGVSMVSFSQSEEVVEEIAMNPAVGVCTDGLPGGKPHPRSFGAFARYLRWLVKETGSMKIETAVHKMTGLMTDALRLRDYGHIRPGAVANVVVLDMSDLTDTATYAEPINYPEGIKDFFVRGRPVIRSGEPTGQRPGDVVRRLDLVL